MAESRTMAVCSVCGSFSDMSQTQKRKPVNVRRCTQCVGSNRFIGDSEQENDNNDPEGIHVEIETDGCPVLQTQTRFGRSVHMESESEYCIKVSNNSPELKGQKLAVVIRVDGQKVSPTPILFGKQRVINGFTLKRMPTEELYENENGRRFTRYLIVKDVARFLLSSSSTRVATSRGRGNTNINNRIGTIELEFYRTKMVHMQRGSRTRVLRNPIRQNHQERSAGLLATTQGHRSTETCIHCGGNKKPLADLSRPLGTCKLFLCDRSVPSLGDFLQ